MWVLCPALLARLFQTHVLEAPWYRIQQCHKSPLQAYAEIMQLIEAKCTQYKIPHTCQRLTTFRRKRVKQLPSAPLYPKGKSQEALEILKVRIVISHYGQPSTPEGKLTSRCLSVICKEASALENSLEIFNMLDAKSIFSQAVQESRQCVDEWGAVELDLVDMYPNRPKQHELQALREALTALQKSRQNRRPVQYCAVSHWTGNTSDWSQGCAMTPVQLQAVEQYVQYVLFGNA